MVNDISVVSLDDIKWGGWKFKISENDYEDGVLVIAVHDFFGYTHVKYFLSTVKAREWIDTMVAYTKELLREALRDSDTF